MEREERGRKVEQGSSRRKKGFGDLFRYFQRSLSESNEVEKAFDVREFYSITFSISCQLDGEKHDRVLEVKQVHVQ